MPLVVDLVDAVVGADTHRATHALQTSAPSGASIATLAIDNDDAVFEQALAWIVDHAPGPRVVVGLEGPAVTASACPVRCRPRAWWSLRWNAPRKRRGGVVSPIPSTRGSRRVHLEVGRRRTAYASRRRRT